MRLKQITFFICAIALLLSGLYSGERLFFVGFALMMLVLALSIFSLVYAALTFKYLQTLSPAEGVKGETVEYTLQFHNEYIFPMAYATVYYDTIDSLLSGSSVSTTISLMPRSNAQWQERVYCRFRGRWPVGVKKVEVRDLFGMFRVRLNVTKFMSHKKLSLLVRPRILHLDRLPMRRKNDEGPMETAPRQAEDVAMMADIRKYRQGDQLKRIHWKLTARQREIMVKNYEESSLPDLLLYLDTSNHGLPAMDALNLEDTLVECATAVVHHLLQNDLPVSLITYNDTRMQLRGGRPEHFGSFYTVLSDIPFDGKFPIVDVLMNEMKLVTHSGNLFLITWALSDKLYDLLMIMSNSGMNITVIYVALPPVEGKSEIAQATEAGRAARMVSEMRNNGIVVLDMMPGGNLAERIGALQ